MKTQSFISIGVVLICALFILSCAKEDPIVPVQDDQSEMIIARKNAVVPFKGFYTTEVLILGPPVGGWLHMDISAEGNATHLGNSSWNGIQRTFLFSNPQMVICDSVTFVAANGDMLIGWYDGDGYGNPFSPEGVTFDGNMYITNGTNRFEDVTGTLPYSGKAFVDPLDPTRGYGEITFEDGFLTFP